jgi:protein-disulfide isomerase
MLILVGAAAGSAVWFSIVQKWVIGSFCPYCMATHITGVLLAVLVISRAPRQFDDDSTDDPQRIPTPVNTVSPVAARRIIRPWPAIGLAFVGLTLAGLLAASQVALAPKGVARGGATQNNLPALDPHAVPLLGSPDAPYVVTLLFDYKCPHCQHLHSMLDEVIRRYNGKLAFALCPAPLNPECNPYIAQEVDEFKDSCELAKIALAVWLAKREAFPAFDRWMFSPEPGALWHPRSLDAAKAKAVELVGQAKLDAAQADPWIDQYLQTSIQIYGQTIRGGNAVPKLVLGSRWVIPEPYNADDLVAILHDSLAVPRP